MKIQTISFFEIYLIIMMSISFAYIVGQTNELNNQLPVLNKESSFISKMRNGILGYLSNGLVSAQGVALWTCQTNVNGTNCQEYSSEVCNSVCAGSCFPGRRENLASCQIGTCYDSDLGTCSAGSPRFSCEQSGGEWTAQQPAQCNRECCLINPDGQGNGDQTQFATQQQCNYLGQTLGTSISWVPVAGEVECLQKANTQARGACVLNMIPEEQKYNCKTTSQSDCLTRGGTFYANQLCTNPALNTTCERTANTKCFANDNLDGVYYVDDCENRANIYDSSKLNDVSYWNNIVPIASSCLMGASGTSIPNQASCGNCQYLLGSICGEKTASESASYGNYVCKDLSCVDEWGDERANMESWCAFDGRIGVDDVNRIQEATNSLFEDFVPLQPGESWCVSQQGSEEYRNKFLGGLLGGNLFGGGNEPRSILTVYRPPNSSDPNGTITHTPANLPNELRRIFPSGHFCSNDSALNSASSGSNSGRSVDLPGSSHYRKVCFDGKVRTETCAIGREQVCSETIHPETKFSTAICRINLGQNCLSANTGNLTDLNKCEDNPDCFLKHVDIGKNFRYDICVPKFPLGINSAELVGDEEEPICKAFGSQKCTYMEKKGWGGWRCKINCACKTADFTESMNNVCSSIGDCGGKINLNGDFSHDGYSTSAEVGVVPPKVRESYISGMQRYKTAIKGQNNSNLNTTQLFAMYGISESDFEGANIASTFGTYGLGAIGLIHGGTMLALLGIAGETAVMAAVSAVAVAEAGVASATALGMSTATANVALTAATESLAGAVAPSFMGALGGLAVGAGVGYVLGSLFGLEGSALTFVTVAGGSIGLAAALGAFGLKAQLFMTNPYLIVGIILYMVLSMIFGIGKTRQRVVEFNCGVWQPPSGGAKCELCNSDSLPCNKYKCESFGKNCEYLNEGTGEEICINNNPNDSTQPTISENANVLSSGFSYQQTNTGIKIKNNANSDGCLQEYSSVTWGVILNEPGQCRVSENHAESYEEMSSHLSNSQSSLLKYNHTALMAMPTLDEIGVSGIDPNRRGTHKLYVKCQDSSGNSNSAAYSVEFCVSPANDVTAPMISQFNPVSPGFVGLNSTNKIVQFYTNEPATCRWSLNDKEYSQMIDETMCNNGINQITLNGWSCSVDLPVGNNNETNYYFRCADQPWLGTNETNPSFPDDNSNVNSESFNYKIIRTTTPLTISSMTPNGITLSVGSLPVNVNLEIRTSGGINNGNSFCSYGVTSPNIRFFTTSTNVHKQNNLQLFEGEYNYKLECEDRAGNIATENMQFTILADTNGPLITRVYSSGSTLSVITNEPASCAWNTNDCNFNFANGTLLSGTGKGHTMAYTAGVSYKIKCKDSFGNMGTCLNVVRGY